MIVCPKCKEEIEDDSLYCDQCGDELKVCPKCQSLSRGKRCTQCGGAVVTKSGAAQSASAQLSARETLYMVNASQGICLEIVDGGIIGRKQGNYLSVFSTQMYVSGVHARFAFDNSANRWSVADQDSTNGTFVNDTPLAPETPHFIGKGDRLRIAAMEFVIE